MAPIRYNNRVAIVTGAGAGLGRQYAIMLASRGAKILVNDMDRASGAATVVLIEAAGGEAALQVGSVTEGAAVVEAAVSRWGRIDIVVSNAGVLRDVSFHKMTDAAFETVLSVHLRGSYAVVRAAWPHMRAAGYGRVVLITSVNGLYGQFGQANYSAAKLGLVGLAKTLAIEGASKNIKVNALAPGAGTAMTATVMPAEIVAKWKPEYVVPCLAYLCSEELPASGGVFESGGGWMAQVRWQRSAGAYFDISQGTPGFTPEDVRDAWGKISGFDAGACAPEEDGLIGANTPQIKQIMAKL